MGSQIEENYSGLTWKEERHRREFCLLQKVRYWWLVLVRLIFTLAEQQPFEMYLSRTMLSEIIKPRLRGKDREQNVGSANLEEKWAEHQKKM